MSVAALSLRQKLAVQVEKSCLPLQENITNFETVIMQLIIIHFLLLINDLLSLDFVLKRAIKKTTSLLLIFCQENDFFFAFLC